MIQTNCPLTDIDLIRQVQRAADSAALRQLFLRYRPVLWRVRQNYYLPGYSRADWEQEGLLALHAAVRDFQPTRSRSFGVFYRLNLTHRVVDQIRYRQAKKRNAQTLSLEANHDFFADTLVDPQVTVRDHAEVQEALARVLPRLSAVEGVVLTGLLRGLSLATIGERHHLAPQRVTAALHRSRQKLRRSLAE